jgi:hypothetical protein
MTISANAPNNTLISVATDMLNSKFSNCFLDWLFFLPWSEPYDCTDYPRNSPKTNGYEEHSS